ncbi:hypothetical protein ACFWGN_17960 [Oerskovia sp. NPDC060338]|uniref:hypothetical protein n=1 Tax=Oerskovia sp. NPDC060338 TaxID=3347100 RepID=UPI00365AE311
MTLTTDQPTPLLSHTVAIARLRLCLLDTDQARLAKHVALRSAWSSLALENTTYENLPDDGDALLESADRLELVGGPAAAVAELRDEATRQARRRTYVEGTITELVEAADELERDIARLDTLHADYELALENLGA